MAAISFTHAMSFVFFVGAVIVLHPLSTFLFPNRPAFLRVRLESTADDEAGTRF
jgi:hypothetical protein